MSCRMAQLTIWNLLALWLAAVAPAADWVPDRLIVEPASTILDGRRASGAVDRDRLRQGRRGRRPHARGAMDDI